LKASIEANHSNITTRALFAQVHSTARPVRPRDRLSR